MKPLAADPTVLQEAHGYASFFLRALKSNFTYRASTLLGLLAAGLSFTVILLVWVHVAERSPDGAPPDLFAYLALAFVLNFTMTMNLDFRIGQRIRQGWIATDLLKPVDFQAAQAMQALADSLFNGFLGLGVLGAALALLGPELLPAGAGSLALFVPSFLLAFLVQYSLAFLFIQGAFYTYSHYGVFALRLALHQTFSGLSAPLEIYPDFLQAAALALPFRHVVHTPVRIYQGAWEAPEALAALASQAAWAAVLLLLGRLVMARAVRQLEIQGG